MDLHGWTRISFNMESAGAACPLFGPYLPMMLGDWLFTSKDAALRRNLDRRRCVRPTELWLPCAALEAPFEERRRGRDEKFTEEISRKKLGGNMKAIGLILVLCFTAAVAFAQKHSDFSGAWELNPDKSKNIGMMAQMKMTQTIQQTDSSLDITIHTTFQGRDDDSQT